MASLKEQAAELAEQYRVALLSSTVAFWEKHSLDTEHGGYFTCLNEDGSVFDTDKYWLYIYRGSSSSFNRLSLWLHSIPIDLTTPQFVWLQARQVWLFSKLYNTLPSTAADVGPERHARWLLIAESGAKFLAKYGKNEDGHFYFSLTREGKPITHPHSIFSDCFAAMAFAQYSKAAKANWAQELAVKTFESIEKRKGNPKGAYNKAYPNTRGFKSLAIPMIDMTEVIDIDVVDRITKNVAMIFDVFLDKNLGLLRENVADNERDQDTFEGRLLSPGHAIEACWFLMDVARKRHIPHVVHRAGEILLRTVEYGWDPIYGGLFYFIDSKGKPPQQLEWDQKLWWVHVEALVGLSLGYLLSTEATHRARYEEWYTKVHEWAWKRFPDKENGEWFGYLNRRGEVLLRLKGKWKGCFHVPRSMLLCWQNFDAIAKATPLASLP